MPVLAHLDNPIRDTAEMVPQVSVAPYLALLEEPEHELQAVALTELNKLVDVFWSEIADASTTMYYPQYV